MTGGAGAASRHLRFALALLWRGEAAHLALFVLAPPLLMLLKSLVAIVLLPFALLGAGDRSIDLQRGLRHLHEPGCWVMAAPCSFATAPVLRTEGRAQGGGTRPAPLVVTVRHAWFAAWIAWILMFIVRRERRLRVTARGDVS